MIVRTRLPLLFRAVAITFWPFVFVVPDISARQLENIMLHENVHLRQQKRWAIYGLGIGLLAWYALYLLALPVGYNPWRYRWESEAFKAQGYVNDDEVHTMLQEAPYYLWWHSLKREG